VITQAAGKRVPDVLARFDMGVDTLLARAVQNGKLPQSVADARVLWFKQSARLQIDQPGFTPALPGLHEMHGVMIRAAVEVSGMRRDAVRTQLISCKTLADIVATKGKTSADVVAQALTQIDALLQQAVAGGTLTTAQRGEWRAALQTTATNMTTTPGLHFAGKACAK
jgi:hypothetical protein